MLNLIDQFPIFDNYYKPPAEILIEKKKYDLAFRILEKEYVHKPDAFCTKWLGIINLSRKNLDKAVKFLNESMNYKSDDSQVLYNLAGAYALQNKFTNAYEIINRCVEVDPEFPGAAGLKQQLSAIINR